jgi:hypothetical protein
MTKLGGSYSALEVISSKQVFGFVVPEVLVHDVSQYPYEKAKGHMEYALHFQKLNQWCMALKHVQLAFECLTPSSLKPHKVSLGNVSLVSELDQILYEARQHFLREGDNSDPLSSAKIARKHYSQLCNDQEKAEERLKREGKWTRLRREVGDWVLPNDNDSFFSRTSSSSRSTNSYRYGVSHSPSSLLSIASSA